MKINTECKRMGKHTHGPGQPMAQLSSQDREMIAVLQKKRDGLQAEIQELVLCGIAGGRSLNVAERNRVAACKQEIRDIGQTLRALRA